MSALHDPSEWLSEPSQQWMPQPLHIHGLNQGENKQLVARVLYPGIFVDTWSILIGWSTKTKLGLILEITLH